MRKKQKTPVHFSGGEKVITPKGEAIVYWVIAGVGGTTIWAQFDQEWPLTKYDPGDLDLAPEFVQLSLGVV